MMTTHFLVKYSFIGFVAVLFLNACGSSPKDQTNKHLAEESNETVVDVRANKRNSQYFIQKANASGADDEQRRAMYINALKYAIAEQKKPAYVLAIIGEIDSAIFNSVALDIELAKGLLFAAQYKPELNTAAEMVMSRLNQGNIHKKHQLDLWVLKAQSESNRLEHIQVVRTIFRIEQLHQSQLTEQDRLLLSQLLWKHLLHVSTNTLKQFQNDFSQDASGWIALAQVIKQHLTDAIQLPMQLAQWRRLYPNLENSKYLPTRIKLLLATTPYDPKNIALLLPLSGKLQRQSESIRNGFLAATNMRSDMTITVIDTDKYELAQIENLVVNNQIDFIVGPLLKETVETLMHSDILAKIPSLHLNVPEFNPMLPKRDNAFFFALAPEDEIEQAVEYFIDNDYQNPTLIFADNSLGRRLAQHFNEFWLKATTREVESIAFKSKSKLGEAVEDLLDVNLSKKRIAEMKQLFGSALETASRSRTDIDAVYIIANSQQTRLIKPFFDVNVSVFGEKLPIFGSSRSYLVDESKSQKRDLNDLTFTEMPWLIRNKAPSLHTLYSQVGEQQTQLKKLFAFGYDAQQLIYAIKQLTILTDQSFDGLTGKLAVTTNNRIKRDLEWSKYQQGRIIGVAKVGK